MLCGLVLVAAAVTETSMRPDSDERIALVSLFVTLAAAAGFAAWLVPARLMRVRSLSHTVLVIALAAAATTLAAVALIAGAAFISSHDLTLVAIALGLSAALAVVVATSFAEPLTADLRRLDATAARARSGDLAAASGITRPDEVGAAARALDDLITHLARVEADRAALEQERRVLLAAIAHDLRTPLTAMRAVVDAVGDGATVDPQRLVNSVGPDLDALGALVDDLLLLARMETDGNDVERGHVDLAELADEALEALSPTAERAHVKLHLVADGPVSATGSPAELGRVIRNLVDNAIRHAPAGTDVRVEASRDGGAAQVRVVDQGEGFPDGFEGMAFQHFTMADPLRDRAAGGSGLGLAIARTVVEAHGGRIWIEPGPGGVVTFALPGADRFSVS